LFPSVQRLAIPVRRKVAWGANVAVLFLFFFTVDVCLAQAPPSNPMAIPLTTIQKGNFSGIREPLQVTVRTQNEWEDLWKRHTSIQSPPSSLPSVNFTTEMVVGLFAGEKTTGGYDVELTRAELKDSTLYVYYVERNPASGGMAIQALTQPFNLAKLARHDGAVVFVKQSP
jgi:hypothetical protein